MLCEKIQKSFMSIRKLFLERYAPNVEVVDPQLRNNPELVHTIAQFEKDWCLGKTHLVPKRNKDHLISFSALIEITCEKYPEFKEMVECSDAEIFSTIPYLIVLKSSLDTGKEALIAREICERFYPMLKESKKYEQLVADFDELRMLAGESFFSFYNKIEAQILLGEKTPD